MLLVIPSGLKVSDPIATVFNSKEKAYQDDVEFQQDYDLKTVQMVYRYQQKEHMKLMNELQQVPLEYHKLIFHSWNSNNAPVCVVKTQVHEML